MLTLVLALYPEGATDAKFVQDLSEALVDLSIIIE